MKKKRYLAIDGGGTKAIVSLVYLSYLEYQLSTPIVKIFDLMAGSSSGGILAAALALPHPDDIHLPKEEQRPKFTVNELMAMYLDMSNKVFRCNLGNSIMNLWGLLGPRYDSSRLEEFLDEEFDSVKGKELLTEVMTTAYNLDLHQPSAFNSRSEDHRDLLVKEMVMATTAAPTYFSPHEIKGLGRFVDGAIFAPTPAIWLLMGLERLFSSKPEDLGEEIMNTTLVSIGTSSLNPSLSNRYDGAEGWGLLKWVMSIFEVFDDGVTDTIDRQIKALLKDNSYRLDVKVTDLQDLSLDNTDKTRLKSLYDLTKESIFKPDYQDIRELVFELQSQMEAEGVLPECCKVGELKDHDTWVRAVDKSAGF